MSFQSYSAQPVGQYSVGHDAHTGKLLVRGTRLIELIRDTQKRGDSVDVSIQFRLGVEQSFPVWFP